MNFEELQKISADVEKKKVMKKKAKSAKKSSDIEAQSGDALLGLGQSVNSGLAKLLNSALVPFGVDVQKRAIPKLMRAESYAHKFFFTWWRNMRSDFGVPPIE